VLKDYQTALQVCGPDLDTAKQNAVEEYNEDAAGLGMMNATGVNDPNFEAWLVHSVIFREASDNCRFARQDLLKAEVSASVSSTAIEPSSASFIGDERSSRTAPPATSSTTTASNTAAVAAGSSLILLAAGLLAALSFFA
jgi:hypothetical protein